MVLLFQLLLPLQKCVHTVVTAANLLVVLFLQHGGYAAQAADAASPRAHPAAATSCRGRLGLTGTSRYAQSFSSPIDELLCCWLNKKKTCNITTNTQRPLTTDSFLYFIHTGQR